MRAPGSPVNSLPPWRISRAHGAEPQLREPWHTADRPHRAAPPQLALPAMVAIATAGLVGAPAPTITRARNCLQLTAKKIRDLTKSARREGVYTSHTDRHRRDAHYVAQCQAHIPSHTRVAPIPLAGVGARRWQ